MGKILVVEDDPDVAALVDHRLSAAGHAVTVALDGEAGLLAARSDVPDLIVLDWMMPRRSGLEVCAELRADARFHATKILMLTARARERDVETALAAGANAYVTKPFSPRELAARVDALLS